MNLFLTWSKVKMKIKLSTKVNIDDYSKKDIKKVVRKLIEIFYSEDCKECKILNFEYLLRKYGAFLYNSCEDTSATDYSSEDDEQQNESESEEQYLHYSEDDDEQYWIERAKRMQQNKQWMNESKKITHLWDDIREKLKTEIQTFDKNTLNKTYRTITTF
jgi:uncharacterized Zn finger protein (UPF0148 family)